MKLLVKKLAENAQLPRYGSDYAAGMDLMANVDIDVPPQSRRLIGTGISVSWLSDDFENAQNYYLRIAPRSGLSVKNNIDIGSSCSHLPGQPWRWPDRAGFQNQEKEPAPLAAG